MVFEMLAFSPLNHLTQLIARENLIILSHRESDKSSLLLVMNLEQFLLLSQVHVCTVRILGIGVSIKIVLL
jgi:hypothetical protein